MGKKISSDARLGVPAAGLAVIALVAFAAVGGAAAPVSADDDYVVCDTYRYFQGCEAVRPGEPVVGGDQGQWDTLYDPGAYRPLGLAPKGWRRHGGSAPATRTGGTETPAER